MTRNCFNFCKGCARNTLKSIVFPDFDFRIFFTRPFLAKKGLFLALFYPFFHSLFYALGICRYQQICLGRNIALARSFPAPWPTLSKFFAESRAISGAFLALLVDTANVLPGTFANSFKYIRRKLCMLRLATFSACRAVAP